MGIMSSEWRGRLQHWMRTLKDDFTDLWGDFLGSVPHNGSFISGGSDEWPVRACRARLYLGARPGNIAGLEAKWFCLQKHRAKELSWI